MTREKDREKKKLLTQRKMRLVDRRASYVAWPKVCGQYNTSAWLLNFLFLKHWYKSSAGETSSHLGKLTSRF